MLGKSFVIQLEASIEFGLSINSNLLEKNGNTPSNL